MKKKKKHPITIILEDVRSALNVGAIFRTADAAGIEKLVLLGITCYPPHNKIPKTALGAVETVSWEYHKDKNEYIDKISKTIPLIGCEINDHAKNIYEYRFPCPVALIFGNEITGLSEATLRKVKDCIKIPMFGMKESLNVATSVGIITYEVVRQIDYA